jgi:chloride channel 2
MGFVRTYERIDLQLGLWVFTSVVLAVLSTLVCDLISVYAQGSGIPEVKTILSGINFYRYLSISTLVAKVLGLALIQAAGFFVGFQGPMIHISAIIANNVMKLPYFKEFEQVGEYDESSFTKRQLLITSVACGVVCTFGAPYGGILISVELCSSVYLLSNLFKAYVCGTIAFVVYQQFHQYEGYFDDYKKEPLLNTKAESLIHFVVLGVIIGYLASFLIFLSGKLVEMKNSSTLEFLKK